jgi:hypothetical protein
MRHWIRDRNSETRHLINVAFWNATCIKCHDFESQHHWNIAFLNRNILKLCYFAKTFSSCAISAFNYILGAVLVFVYNFLFLCTFSEWKHYKYVPRIIRFASETDNSQQKCVLGGIKLPQFSSATVPKVP